MLSEIDSLDYLIHQLTCIHSWIVQSYTLQNFKYSPNIQLLVCQEAFGSSAKPVTFLLTCAHVLFIL